MNLSDLSGVEILRVGTWNGVKVSPEDLEEMVRAGVEAGFVPPVKISHADDPAGQAFGWVHNLRVAGDRLIADLRDVPAALEELIRAKRYDSVSAEIFFNLKRDGKLFKRALKALAILGEQIPAVSGLKPLSEALLSGAEFESVKEIDFQEDRDMTEKSEKETKDHSQEITALAERVKELSEQNAKLVSASSDEKTAREAASAERQEFIRKLDAVAEENRTLKLAEKMKAVRIPVYKPYMEVLYRMALTSPVVVKFGEGEKVVEKSLEAMLDSMVHMMSEASAWMLKEHGRSTKDRAVGFSDAGEEIAALAEKLTAEKGLSYAAAMKHVLESNPDLKAAYTGVN